MDAPGCIKAIIIKPRIFKMMNELNRKLVFSYQLPVLTLKNGCKKATYKAICQSLAYYRVEN